MTADVKLKPFPGKGQRVALCQLSTPDSGDEVKDSGRSGAEGSPPLIQISYISLNDNKDDSVLDGNSIRNDSGIAAYFILVVNTSENSGNYLQQDNNPSK